MRYKEMKNNNKKRQKIRHDPQKSNKKFKKDKTFIQRSKEMEETHLKRTLMEKDAARELKDKTEFEYLQRLETVESRPDYDELVECLKQETPLNFDSRIADTAERKITVDSEESPDDDEELESNKKEKINHLLEHFGYELADNQVEALKLQKGHTTIQKAKWTNLGDVKVQISESLRDELSSLSSPIPVACKGIHALGAESLLADKINSSVSLKPFEKELLYLASTYKDIYYPQRTFTNCEDIRRVYCLHVVNHVMRSFAVVKQNDKRLELLNAANETDAATVLPDDFRDQSMFRLKALIIVPFRDSAYRVVNMIMQALYQDQGDKWTSSVKNYNKFSEDFTGKGLYFPKHNPKPADYEQTFQGNVDDNFDVGIRFSKKSSTIYANLNASDVLVASPVALRRLLDSTNEIDHDFLHSIEVLVIDQAEVLLAQNWEHLLFSLDHLHMEPKNLPKTDCQRIRSYALNNYTKFYRQTLFFASHEMAEFRSIAFNICHNYAGLVKLHNQSPSVACAISNVVVTVQQTFRRFESSSIESCFDDRFEYFTKEVLPQFKGLSYSHCMILVPSYFDYVRLRNYMKAESLDFVQICEYTEDGKIARARDKFFHSGAHFMLYSERSHFFRRTRVKGIRHLIMYQPPTWPKFYPEIINLMLDTNQNPRDGLQDSMSITVLYSKYDLIRLSNIVGNQMAAKLLKDKKPFSVFSSD